MWNAECGMRSCNGGSFAERRSGLHSAFRIPNSALGAPANLVQLLEPHQHIPRFGPVRRAEDTRLFQLVDDARRATVPDAHAALQQGRRAELVLDEIGRASCRERV